MTSHQPPAEPDFYALVGRHLDTLRMIRRVARQLEADPGDAEARRVLRILEGERDAAHAAVLVADRAGLREDHPVTRQLQENANRRREVATREQAKREQPARDEQAARRRAGGGR